jgi:hypothetical protein
VWAAWIYDVHRYGLHNFWAMGLFFAAYTYLGLPLVTEFLRLLGVLKSRRKSVGAPDDKSAVEDLRFNPITMYEVVAYSALIVLITLTASGYFDLFIPWGRLQ